MDGAHHFSQSYAEARRKFLGAAEAADVDAHSHVHPLLGPEGETLAIDVVRDGAADAASLLIISSGCHGVEGYCGSGVQVALLNDPAWLKATREAGIAVLYVHALNPYGFAWLRRTTQENVDLNRNFADFSQPLPANPAYDELAHLLVPEHWPPPAAAEAQLQRLVAEMGPQRAQEAVSGGQYSHPQGLFYGGVNPCWSHIAWRHVLRDHGRRCRRLGWIDLHTGLGAQGVGERIFAGRDEPAALERARAWWGDGITSIYDGSSSSARLTGLIWMSAYEECPQAEFTAIALEYGTLPLDGMIGALRADQWLDNHPEAEPAQAVKIKQAVRDAFYIDSDEWKQRVLEQAFDAAHAALRGLGRS